MNGVPDSDAPVSAACREALLVGMASSSPQLGPLGASGVPLHQGCELLALDADLKDLGSLCADEEGLGLLVEVKRAHRTQKWTCVEIEGMKWFHLLIPEE